MSQLLQCRTLAGRAFAPAVTARRIPKVSNGSKVFMRRKDSYMVEVLLGEEEPEDIAVRRFMKAVMESKVIDQMRARRYTETKIEAYKRRLRERHEVRKLNLVEPTWEETNGEDLSPKVFDEFFAMDPDNEFGLGPLGQEDGFLGGYTDGMWGGYMDGQSRGNWEQGGYMDQGAGGNFTAALPVAEGQAGVDAQGNFTYTSNA